MTTLANNPNMAGQKAGRVTFCGNESRYAVYPVHTRFAAVQWFVADAEQLDKSGRPAIVRQAETREEAIAGL